MSEKSDSPQNYVLIDLASDDMGIEKITDTIIDTIKKTNTGKRNWFTEYDLKHNERFSYFSEYIMTLGVQTVILETRYYDKQYVEDYGKYYCKSFKHYSKTCMRFHFFTESFDDNVFKNFLMNYNPEDISKENRESRFGKMYNSYCGFSIIKPIPYTIFGRTCLKTYNTVRSKAGDGRITEKRFYPTIRMYKANLYGMEFRFDSVAYQEQDNQVFVCAAAAIWVAFQSTSKLFDHMIPTPYDITLQATGRKIPKKEGLTNNEMERVISEQGLNPFTVNLFTVSEAKAFLYAYLRCGIPVILGGQIQIEEDTPLPEENPTSHAITVLGYDMVEQKEPVPYSRLSNDEYTTPSRAEKLFSCLCRPKEKRKKIFLASSLIKEIYVHDDQVGAFARMKFVEEITADAKGVVFADIPWRDHKDFKGTKPRFTVDATLIPLYHKIRIPFSRIFTVIDEFNTHILDDDMNFIWDIYLTTTCNLKEQLRLNIYRELDTDIRMKIISSNMPRFIWIADAYNEYNLDSRQPVFSFYFDATDMENSDFFLFSLHNSCRIFLEIYDVIQRKKESSDYENTKTLLCYQLKQIINYYYSSSEDKDRNEDSNSIKYIIKKYYESYFCETLQIKV